MSDEHQTVIFKGDSLDVIRSFPTVAKREIGYQIDRLEKGYEPNNWRPMKAIVVGVREIRVRDENNQYRVIYYTKIVGKVVILHAFIKKDESTRKSDIEIAKQRLNEVGS